ncbi:AAA family ATPase [Lactobacillus sp. LC28-10]|uniref:AAA family ATPase n=1 Tax=Secundilactobacillus angelensis TaxID=2722706 RepID=A0ABX1KWU2_9LACO|nr:ATP-binding protein [Secundilactobacillus angelensis]MCH5461465.1 ATP-binding protein [Secundilactobacillus angelensis]NLR17722.1 AAA family ATPase [Secundilactobacillus angelensis]
MLSFQELLKAIPVVIEAGNVPAIVGEAGIGKSALVQTVADQMDAKLYTTVVSLSEKGDLAIPVPPMTDSAFVKTSQYGELADVKYGYTHTLIEIIQWAEAHPNQPIIWFLDEFNRGTQAVQSELMNLVLQRQINNLRLPDSVHMIIAENPDATMAGFETSDYGVTVGDAAINDRTVRLVMRAAASDWLEWAKSNGQIVKSVCRFIEENPQELAPVDHDTDLYPTPRAWQRVSRNLQTLSDLPTEDQQRIRLDILQGDLGVTVGQSFERFIRQQNVGLSAPEIYAGNSLSPAVAQIFTESGIDQQQSIMNSLIQQVAQYPLTDDSHASHFTALLNLMPVDAQFAVALKLAEVPELLERLYQAAQEHPLVKQLYDQLTAIGLKNNLD